MTNTISRNTNEPMTVYMNRLLSPYFSLGASASDSISLAFLNTTNTETAIIKTKMIRPTNNRSRYQINMVMIP